MNKKWILIRQDAGLGKQKASKDAADVKVQVVMENMKDSEECVFFIKED